MSVPKVEMLTHFLKECVADRFSPKGQNASGKIEKVEDIEILPSRERPRNAFIEGSLFISLYSGNG